MGFEGARGSCLNSANYEPLYKSENNVTYGQDNNQAQAPEHLVRHLQLLADESLRHASLGVVLGIETPWLNRLVISSGFADADKTVPVTRHHLFQIGSQTKTFTAACVQQLVNKGRLSMDTRVSEVLPGFPGDEGITVKELLNHTSGIGNASRLLDPINYPVDFELSFDDRMLLTKTARSSFKRGTGWEYNNAGYWVLAELVSAISQMRFSDYLQDNILTPLGLNDTFIGSDYTFQAENMARGFHTDARGNEIETTNHLCLAEAGAAGDLVSSIDDMLTWLSALIDSNSKAEVTLHELAHDAVAGQVDTVSNSSMYGSGVQKFHVAGRECWGHGGAMCGYMSIGVLDPQSGTRICILSNKHTLAGAAWMALQVFSFNLLPMVMCVLRENEPCKK